MHTQVYTEPRVYVKNRNLHKLCTRNSLIGLSEGSRGYFSKNRKRIIKLNDNTFGDLSKLLFLRNT